MAGESGGGVWAEGLGPALTYFSYRMAAWLAENLPIKVADALTAAFALGWHRLDRKRRRTVRKNLGRVCGEDADLDRIVREAFLSYGEYWLETFRLGRYSATDLTKLIEAPDEVAKVMEDALAEGRGVLVVTPHFGLYDLGSAWMGMRGWPVTTVTEVLKPRQLYEWFTSLRSRWGVEVVPAEKGRLARRIGKILANGEVLALVADRDLGRRGLWADFFGEPTTLPATPPLLMARNNIPLLAGAVYRKNGRLQAYFERIPYQTTGDQARDVPDCAATVARALEGIVRKAPEQWHLFSANWPSDEEGLPPRGSDRHFASMRPPSSEGAGSK